MNGVMLAVVARNGTRRSIRFTSWFAARSNARSERGHASQSWSGLGIRSRRRRLGRRRRRLRRVTASTACSTQRNQTGRSRPADWPTGSCRRRAPRRTSYSSGRRRGTQPTAGPTGVKRPELIENDAPRHDGEDHQHEQHRLGDGARPAEDAEEIASKPATGGGRRLYLKSDGQVSERAQTNLRFSWATPWFRRSEPTSPCGPASGRPLRPACAENSFQTYDNIAFPVFSPPRNTRNRMLRFLAIQNLAVIESVEIDFESRPQRPHGRNRSGQVDPRRGGRVAPRRPGVPRTHPDRRRLGHRSGHFRRRAWGS